MRISELLYRNDDTTKGNCTHTKPDFRPTPFNAALASALKQDGRVDHFRNLNWKRTFLSKTRYMGGRQCSKRLWQTVYDPEPAEEPLPGTIMGSRTRRRERSAFRGGIGRVARRQPNAPFTW